MKILIGYDGSECADAALLDLRQAGLPARAEAFVLSVADVREVPTAPFLKGISNRIERLFGRTGEDSGESLKSHLEQAGELALSAAREIGKDFPEWEVKTGAVPGKPAAELIKMSDEFEPDLLIVGSHGRSALGRLVLGSVSQQILYEAQCPVRIARRKDGADDSATRVMIAVDGSEDAEKAVKTVAERNWRTDAEIRLVAVDDPFTPSETGYISWNPAEERPEETEQSREWIERVIGKPAEILKAAGRDVTHAVKWGDAANMILEEADVWNAGTIFVGARGGGPVSRQSRLLGSVTSRVAARARCSVEIVRS